MEAAGVRGYLMMTFSSPALILTVQHGGKGLQPHRNVRDNAGCRGSGDTYWYMHKLWVCGRVCVCLLLSTTSCLCLPSALCPLSLCYHTHYTARHHVTSPPSSRVCQLLHTFFTLPDNFRNYNTSHAPHPHPTVSSASSTLHFTPPSLKVHLTNNIYTTTPHTWLQTISCVCAALKDRCLYYTVLLFLCPTALYI